MSRSSRRLTRAVIPRPAASSSSTTGQGTNDGHVTAVHTSTFSHTHANTHFLLILFHNPSLDLMLKRVNCHRLLGVKLALEVDFGLHFTL